MDPIDADLAGRTCLVTGSSAGLGREAAGQLAALGATVVLAVRDAGRGEAARAAIERSTGRSSIEVALVDVSSRASIRRFAAEVLARHPVLDVLVNNAGIASNERRESVDGIELTWATNVLGYHLVTKLLLDAVLAAPAGRVVNVASNYAGGLDLDDVEFRRRPYDGGAAYAQSKQANRMQTWALARRLHGTRAVAHAMSPGAVDTALLRSMFPSAQGRSVEAGADTITWLAASEDAGRTNGRFWHDRSERACAFRDPVQEERLVAVCEAMTAG